jgi:hypothetical protein
MCGFLLGVAEYTGDVTVMTGAHVTLLAIRRIDNLSKHKRLRKSNFQHLERIRSVLE